MKDKKKVYQSFALVMQFGINMIVPILLCTFIGVWLGSRTGKDFIVIPLFFIGAFAGFRNIYRMAKSVFEDNTNTAKDQNKEGKNVKKAK